MGSELGNVFAVLDQKLVELQVIWQQYRQLFGENEETVHLVNRAAGLFFHVIQDQLWDSVLLGISKMTDPTITGRRKNLTLNSIPPLIFEESFRAEVKRLCVVARSESEFARDHRNKRIAHEDHNHATNQEAHALAGVSRQAVEGMLASLRAVLNAVNQRYLGNTVMYEDFIDSSGARVLVHRLWKLEQLDAKG